MNSITEEIKKKIRFLELAKEIGNITEAARIMGYHVSTYYNIKKIYDLKGKEGLWKHLRGRPKLDPSIEKEILKLSKLHPKYGNSRLSKELKLKGIKVSSAAIHKIFKKYNLNTSRQRLEKLKTEET
jgi:transposase